MGVVSGSTVTRYDFLPEPKVTVSKIEKCEKDLRRAISAMGELRIALVPSTQYVGIEVPNLVRQIVTLKEVTDSSAFQNAKHPLSIPLGKDIAGKPIVISLSKMPHLAIGGVTGGGKSVCVKAMITSLADSHTPDQLQLVLLDPKKVELTRFKGLPHLRGQIETDYNNILRSINNLVGEMSRRYDLFAQIGAENLTRYNEKADQPLPYIVMVIDELGDLMLEFGDRVEKLLVKLAQLARATGIHMVVATQRPSADILTGLIMANFPARIAFAVASGVNSRVILDQNGAEKLLGNGDMLLKLPDASDTIRVQGCYIK